MMHKYVPADTVVVGKDIHECPVLLRAFRQAEEIYEVPALPTLLLTCIKVL